MIENLKKDLVGKEMSFMDLDNYMMEHGFYSVFNDGVTSDVKECGNVVYTGMKSQESEIIINFTITIDNGDDECEEAFYLLVDSIENF